MTGSRLAVDIGGTFTDLALLGDDGSLVTRKVATDASRPAQAVALAIQELLDEGFEVGETVLHSTTVATNSLLERKLPHIALVTTRGFRDVLQFRRIKRERIYALNWCPPEPLVSRDNILEVDERILADGSVAIRLQSEDLDDLVARLRSQRYEAVAVCLLHSYANPAHERLIEERLRTDLPSCAVALSSVVGPDIGEYERTSTTVAHAALKPVLSRYLAELDAILCSESHPRRLFVMQSSGGLATARQVIDKPALAVESGPAAGALYAGQLAADLGIARAIAFDMGGTTAKACLLQDGKPAEAPEVRVGAGMHIGEGFRERGGYVIRGSAVDIAEVGAGGGSLCWVDPAGVLHVGPESAGASPGPAAYGTGGKRATVTDACVVLGYIETGDQASGLSIDLEKARDAVGRDVADPLGTTVEHAAELVFEVASSNVMRAIHAVTSERGRDPRPYSLIAFGGAGPIHAVPVALALGMKDIVVPYEAATFSAVGLHRSVLRRDTQTTYRRPLHEAAPAELDQTFREIERDHVRAFAEDGFTDVQHERLVDVRFTGQGFELTVSVPPADSSRFHDELAEAFLAMHQREYGHADVHGSIEIVRLRLRTEAYLGQTRESFVVQHGSAKITSTRAFFGREYGWLQCDRLPSTAVGKAPIEGPALITLPQTTVVLPPKAQVHRDAQDNLRVQVGAENGSTTPVRALTYTSGTTRRAELQLFANEIGAVVDRMAYTIARTAYSSIAREAHDFSVAVTDAQGHVPCQGVGVLIHLGTVESAMSALAERGLLPLSEGDVAILNDPYAGGTHLPDFVAVVPVIVDGEAVAYAVAISHMIDVGGSAPGSLRFGASELLQEGLVVPPAKLYEAGRVNEALLGVIRRNVRQPDEVLGDLHGIVAAGQVGASGVSRIAARLGRSQICANFDELILYGTERGELELAALGDAKGTFTDYINDNGVSSDPIRVCVTLKVRSGHVFADFTGSDPQAVTGINATLCTTKSVLEWGIRTMLPEELPDNSGLSSLIHVTAPAGTIVNVIDDGPVANRGLTAFRLGDAVLGALASMYPGRVPAAGEGGVDTLHVGGRRSDGSIFTFADQLVGVTGGGPWGDGSEGIAPPLGNIRNLSVEVLESLYPIKILRYGFEPGTGGAGQYRGGNAMCRSYELLCEQAEVSVRCDRVKYPPWGLAGGEPGTPASCVLVDVGAEERLLPPKHTFTMKRGELLHRWSASGGGYGPPSERDPALIERDRREERL